MTTSERRSPRAGRTRSALVAAGRRLFSERAVDAVTVDDIVQAAEVGKGSFYNHFADRDDLLRSVSAEIRAGVEGAVTRANAGEDDPARRVTRAVCCFLRHAIDEPESAKVLVRVHGGHTSMDTPLNQGLVNDIERGLAAGRFNVPTIEAGALYVLGVSQLALARLCREPSLSLATGLAQQMCALLLRGLGLPLPEADLLAAQASDEIVRRGAYATTEAGATH